MRTIWKYPIPFGATRFAMPEKAKFLSFEVLPCGPCAWFEIEDSRAKTEREFQIVGTGHPIPKYFVYRGTAIQKVFGSDDRLIWHLYELDIAKGPA